MTQTGSPIKTKPIMGNYSGHVQSPYADFIKRVFDLVISGSLLVILSPVFIYLAWRIKRDSPGPVFYRGLRTGKDGVNFYIFKLRTMYEHPDSYQGSRVTAQDDPRITPVGRRLRDTKLNELPQLWNVFKGEMSLVGPRPEDPQIVDEWTEETRSEILSVRPGMTSPASILYYDEENLLLNGKVMQIYMDDVLPSKLRLDQLYVRYRSFLGDLDVLFFTQLVLLPRFQKSSPPEENLLVGPINNLVRRNFSWFTVDTLVTLIAIGIAGLIWRSFAPLDVGFRTAILFGIGFAFLFSLIGAIFGVHRIYWSRSSILDAMDLLPAVAIATGLTLLINQFVLMKDPEDTYNVIFSIWNNQALLPPVMIVVAASIAYFGFVVVRYRERLVTGLASRWVGWRGVAQPAQERALIVGAGETAHYASLMLNNGKYRNTINVFGIVDDDLYKLDNRIHGINVIGRCKDIPNLVEQYDIGLIIFTIHNINPEMRQEILQICYNTQARTVFFPDVAAALSQIARHKDRFTLEWSRANHQNVNDINFPSDLPCRICLSLLSPPQVKDWLEKLENTALQGDMTDVIHHIRLFREVIIKESQDISIEAN